MYNHVIWDWNGTLLDDAWLSLEIVNGLLEKRGLPAVTAERYQQVFGFPLEGYCRKLGFDLEQESYAVLSDAFIEIYEKRRLECHLQDGACRTLEKLRKAGVEQSLLSAYKQKTLVELVTHFELGAFFEAVVGVDNHYGEGKIERGRQRIAELPHPGEQILLVGDTLHDLDVARAMGVDCVLVPSGHQHRRRLESSGERVIERLPEVLELVETGPANRDP